MRTSARTSMYKLKGNVYAIFRPSGCVGTPRGLEHAVGHGLARIADFGYFAQSAGSVSIRVPV